MCSGHYQRWWKSPEGQDERKPHGRTKFKRLAEAEYRTNPEKGCREWVGASASGYGVMTVDGGNESVHRIALEEKLGRPLIGQALHNCDNKICFLADHIYEGTPKKNAQDASERGLLSKGETHFWATLTDGQVKEMRELRTSGALLRELSAKFGVAESTVSRVCNRKRRK